MSYTLYHYSDPFFLLEQDFWGRFNQVPKICKNVDLELAFKKISPLNSDFFTTGDKLIEKFESYSQKQLLSAKDMTEISNVSSEKGNFLFKETELLTLFQELFSIFPHNKDVTQVVFHGFLEFSPSLLKCINILELSGIDIVFCLYYDEFYPNEMKYCGEIYQYFNLHFSNEGKLDQKSSPREPYYGDELDSFLKLGDNKSAWKDKVLAFYSDQNAISDFFYSVNREKTVKELHFTNKEHNFFLFIESLQGLWDDSKSEIFFVIKNIKNCFQYWWLPERSARKLLSTLLKLESIFNSIANFSDFQLHFEENHMNYFKNIHQDSDSPFQFLSIYSSVSFEDLEIFRKSIHQLQELSLVLFQNNPEFSDLKENLLQFKEYHFAGNTKESSQVRKNILQLIDVRLNRLMPENNPPSDILSILREKVRFLWLEAPKLPEYYHRIDCILSDILLGNHNNLTLFRVDSLINRDNYDENCGFPDQSSDNSTHLEDMSYKKEQIENYYLLLFLIHQKKKLPQSEGGMRKYYHPEINIQVNYDRFQAMTAFLCPYRYFQDYIIQNSPLFVDDVAYLKFYENILIMHSWMKMTVENAVDFDSALSTADSIYHSYVPSLSHQDRFDCIQRAKYYGYQSLLGKDKKGFRPFAPSHMEMLFCFGTAYFQENCENKLLPPFDVICKAHVYSLHQVPKDKNSLLAVKLWQGMTDYVNGQEDFCRVGSWCETCSVKKFCQSRHL